MFYLPPSLKFVPGIDIPVDSVPLGKAWWTHLLLLLALLSKHQLITVQCLRVWKYKWHKKNQVANKHYHAQCCHTESNSGPSSFLSDLKYRLKGPISDNIPTNLESQTYDINGMRNLLIILTVKKYFITGKNVRAQQKNTCGVISLERTVNNCLARGHLNIRF